jgi:glycosyltransferase involved in cell wall biosynthesis
MGVPSEAAVLTEASPVTAREIRRPGPSGGLDVAVVICAYAHERWDQTVAAVQSVVSQQPGPSQVLLVIDHNPALATRARRELPGVTVLESDGQPGLSGARNTGLSASVFGITAFLDDDAAARPGWLASLVEPYGDSDVVATGGSINPVWLADRPRWLPPEFYWVVGCSYRGLPDSIGAVRNPIGANMSMRTAPAIGAGGFYSAVGRANGKLGACEETELAIRLSARQPGSVVLYVPEAAVDHNVGYARVRFSYFLRRCWHEGWSKATVVKLVGLRAGLEAERRHVASVLPAAILRDLRQFARGDLSALLRSCATALGVAAAFSGFVVRSAGPREPLRLSERQRSKHT